MRIGYAAVFLVGLVDGIVHDHATADKLLQQKLPRKSDVLIQRQFVLQGNIKAVRKLGMGRQQDFGTDHAALFRVVAELAVAVAV